VPRNTCNICLKNALYYFINQTFYLFAEVNGKQNFKDGNSSIHFKVLDTSGEWMLLGGR
jgi:hypothetical protein